MTRTERQLEGVQKWVDNKCKGTLCFATGVGKTYTAMLAIKRFLVKNPVGIILIIVPTEILKNQWLVEIEKAGFSKNCQVKIINSAVKEEMVVSMLVIDEVHKAASTSFQNIFKKIRYGALLCLTATLERLDGKDSIIREYAPVVDEISITEAILNNWLSPYKEFKVLLDVDLTEYKRLNQEFYSHFAFFNHNFSVAMKCVTDWRTRTAFTKLICSENSPEFPTVSRNVLVHAMGFVRCLKARKKFIYEHPQKIKLANLILQHRKDKKCITFSKTIKIAEQLKYGKVLSSKATKNKNRMTLEEFNNSDFNVIHTSSMADQGLNIPDLSVAVILGFDSSSITKKQRIGRVIRKTEDKNAEIFTLVIKNTVEESWYQKSMGSNSYITISESELINVLEGREYTVKKNTNKQVLFRF